MYINLLDSVGDIHNKTMCISVLRNNCPELDNLQNTVIAERINNNYDANKNRYFTEMYKEIAAGNPNSKYVWVDTGYYNYDGRKMYMQFYDTAFGLQGCYVGTVDEITLNQLGYIVTGIDEDIIEVPEPVVVDKTDTNYLLDNFYSEVYKRLLISGIWSLEDNSLRNYIEIIISRINHLIKDGCDCSDFLILNSDKTKALINTALLDKFGRNIMIVSQKHSDNELSYKKLTLINSKSVLLELGFDKGDLAKNIKRVPFHNHSIKELVFDAEIEDFDLENWGRLTHCIVERRDRFPDKCEELTAESLCADLINAVELGVKLSKYDSSYIKPIYSRQYNEINFIIPYHVGGDFSSKPDLGLLVTQNKDGFWHIVTILDYNMCVNDIRLLALYTASSF